MSKTLSPGLIFMDFLMVAERHTVPHVCADFTAFADMPPVFATALLVGFAEATCIKAIQPYLAEGQHSVGTHIDLSHNAPTPVGLSARVEIELLNVEGRKLRFKVRCFDDAGPIGEGFHERYIIDLAKFNQRSTERKLTKQS